MTTLCVFGDSITWGAGDPNSGGWVARLKSYIETEGRDTDVYNCGVSGDNTSDLLQRFKAEATAREAAIIIFAIGINDSGRVRPKNEPKIGIKTFQENLGRLLDQAKELTDKIIFVGLTKVDESKTRPLPWNKARSYDNKTISEYNAAIEGLCHRNGLRFIDMIDLLKDTDLDDGLHPNAQGHKKMFEKMKESLLKNGII